MTTSAPYLLAMVYKAARIDVSDGRTLSQRWDLGLRFLSPIYPSVDAMSIPQSQLPPSFCEHLYINFHDYFYKV